jgi:hypothetical protein
VAGFSSLSFVVAELNPSTGAADTSYNTSGVASVAVAGSGSAFAFLGIAAAPNGDLILAGAYNTGSGFSTSHHIDLVAITPAGGPEASFGTSGIDAISTHIRDSVWKQLSRPACNQRRGANCQLAPTIGSPALCVKALNSDPLPPA